MLFRSPFVDDTGVVVVVAPVLAGEVVNRRTGLGSGVEAMKLFMA